MNSKNFFAGNIGIIIVGIFIGLSAVFLQLMGNPGNMGICVACFERDIAGALGLHRVSIVQYIRPEIIGFVIGSMLMSLFTGEFRARGGSSPLVRFLLGIIAAMGTLVFLGCPWRTILRLAGGDGNALLGIAGLICGIGIGTFFFRKGFSLGSSSTQNTGSGYIFPLLMVGLLLLLLFFPQIADKGQSGPIFYSLPKSGPGAAHAPLFYSLCIALAIGALAQRSRFCTMGAFRDLILFRYAHLFWGVLAMFFAAFLANYFLGSFHPGFVKQPVSHTDGLWNFMGMATAGLAFALAGGCPGRQLFMAGEGDTDSAIFCIGMIVGAALAHNFGTASSGAGIGVYGVQAAIIGLAICLCLGFVYSKKA